MDGRENPWRIGLALVVGLVLLMMGTLVWSFTLFFLIVMLGVPFPKDPTIQRTFLWLPGQAMVVAAVALAVKAFWPESRLASRYTVVIGTIVMLGLYVWGFVAAARGVPQ